MAIGVQPTFSTLKSTTTMKVLTESEADAHQKAVIYGGAKGFFGGLAAALPASYLLQKRSTYYRSLPTNLKAFGIVTIVVPSFIIAAERAGLAFEKEQWSDVGKSEMDVERARAQAQWETYSTREKLADITSRHPYSLIGGSWALSVVGTYAWISRDRLATPLQKITQTRVWAQGMTLGILIAAAALMHGRRKTDHIDHSWRVILEEEEAEKRMSETEKK